MEQRTLPAWKIRPSRGIEWQSNPHLKKAVGDHPGKRAEPMLCDLILLRPPSGRQAEPHTLVFIRLKMADEPLTNAVAERRPPQPEGFDICWRPSGSCDQPHWRLAGRGEPRNVMDEGGDARSGDDETRRVEVASLPVV